LRRAEDVALAESVIAPNLLSIRLAPWDSVVFSRLVLDVRLGASPVSSVSLFIPRGELNPPRKSLWLTGQVPKVSEAAPMPFAFRPRSRR